MKKRNIFLVILISLILINTVSFAQIGTPISEGCTITEPGWYYLENKILGNVIIDAKNVFLYSMNNLQIATGYTYDSTQYNNDKPAIIVKKDSCTIKSISVAWSKIGVLIEPGVVGTKIMYCDFRENYTGIKMDNVSDTEITDCDFAANRDYAVYLNQSSHNKLLRNVFVSTHLGDGFVLKNHSDYNEISKNTLNEGWLIQYYGIYIGDSCTGNFGEDNTVIGDKKGNYGCDINGNDVNYTSTAIDDDQYTIPQEFILNQNYPNPFNPETTIEYSLPASAYVIITIYDIKGRRIKTLVDEFQNSGKHSIQFRAENLPTGKYFYQLNAGGNIFTKSMLLIK